MEINSTEGEYLNIKNVLEIPTPFSAFSSFSESRVEQITFFFIYKKLMVDRYRDIINLPDFVREQRPPILNVVQVNVPQIFDHQTTYKSIERELSGWDLSDFWRQQLINGVIRSAKKMLGSVSTQHNVLGIYAIFEIRQNRSVSSRRITDDVMIQQSIEEREPNLVPAADASIKLLEKKILVACDINETNCESCRVCLEDFIVGCQALCMPCAHLFHKDCIIRWLKTNHYCPICRFEMPTS